MFSPLSLKTFLDLSLWLIAALLAYAFRMPRLDLVSWNTLAWYLLVTVLVATLVEKHFALHRQGWRTVGTEDLKILVNAVATVTILVSAAAFLFYSWMPLPRTVPIMAGFLALLLLGGFRMFARLMHERQRATQVAQAPRRRVLIVGAGSAGTMLVKEMQKHPEAGLLPIGFLDDEVGKARQRFSGVPVLGCVDDLPEVVKQTQAEEVLIAVPSAGGSFVRRVVGLAVDARVRYRTIPGVFEILSGEVNIEQIRDVNIEDLLRRPPAKLEMNAIAGYLQDRTVLITGAGGSIGSELVRQIVAFKPRLVILFGRGENSIFAIQQELNRSFPQVPQLALIGDVRDAERIEHVIGHYRPEVIFHAAAHKHVPLMEASPSEAILNNVIGTQNLVESALRYQVQRFVNVSTDKAVNPTSVMGASKRLAERVVSAAASRAGSGQSFVSVRFGNVLGSRGSVVPTFLQQIREGGPVTVTHPDMVRYFMTIPEAAKLVLQAGAMAENGRVYLLHMGEPVKIADLARDVIRLSGARDIEVTFSGIRPGEKLYEELLTSSEGTEATHHSDIFSAPLEKVPYEYFKAQILELSALAHQGKEKELRAMLSQMIPENKFGQIG